jgi:hypothetical protein
MFIIPRASTSHVTWKGSNLQMSFFEVMKLVLRQALVEVLDQRVTKIKRGEKAIECDTPFVRGGNSD